MAKARGKRKKRRRGGGGRRSGGVMTGLRGGFKNIANSVAGTDQKKRGRSSWLSTLVTVALVLAALGLLLYRAS